MQMTPSTIASKARTLKAHLDRIAPDVEASRHDLARRGLASLQRQTVLLLRLVELQLSGAAGAPHHRPRRSVSRRAEPPAPQIPAVEDSASVTTKASGTLAEDSATNG
jgi:hypothetical protein